MSKLEMHLDWSYCEVVYCVKSKIRSAPLLYVQITQVGCKMRTGLCMMFENLAMPYRSNWPGLRVFWCFELAVLNSQKTE